MKGVTSAREKALEASLRRFVDPDDLGRDCGCDHERRRRCPHCEGCAALAMPEWPWPEYSRVADIRNLPTATNAKATEFDAEKAVVIGVVGEGYGPDQKPNGQPFFLLFKETPVPLCSVLFAAPALPHSATPGDEP